MPDLFPAEHFARFVPTAATTLIVAPLSLAYACLTGAVAARLRTRRGVRAPYTRKLFHFTIFTAAAAVQWLWDAAGVVVFGIMVTLVVLYAVWRAEGHPLYEALARPTDQPHRSLFILIPLATTAAGGLLSNLLFQGFAFVGYLVCGWGDAAGEPVGTRWGRHRYSVPSLAGVKATRSLEGSAAVLLFGAAAAFTGLVAVGFTAEGALPIALAAGFAGALTEAVSTHGLDNLTVQLAASAAAYLVAR